MQSFRGNATDFQSSMRFVYSTKKKRFFLRNTLENRLGVTKSQKNPDSACYIPEKTDFSL